MGTKVREQRVILYFGSNKQPVRGTKELRDAYQGDYNSISDAETEAKQFQLARKIDWWVILIGNYKWHSSWSSK